MREGVDGVVFEVDIFESLVDEGIEVVSEGGIEDVILDKQRSWRGIVLFLGKMKKKEIYGVKVEEWDLVEEFFVWIFLVEEFVIMFV